MVQRSLLQVLFFIPSVAHKLPDGVRTEFFQSLESSGTNLLLPTTVEGFYKMIDTVLHQSNKFKFHRRLSEVLLNERIQKYESFKESKSLAYPAITALVPVLCIPCYYSISPCVMHSLLLQHYIYTI